MQLSKTQGGGEGIEAADPACYLTCTPPHTSTMHHRPGFFTAQHTTPARHKDPAPAPGGPQHRETSRQDEGRVLILSHPPALPASPHLPQRPMSSVLSLR